MTTEQIWGVPEDELPEAEIKDYFEYGDKDGEKEKEEQPAADGSEA